MAGWRGVGTGRATEKVESVKVSTRGNIGRDDSAIVAG